MFWSPRWYSGSAQTWYHSDRLGSIRLMTDASGNPANTYDYQAFGGTQSSSGAVYNDRGFTGHFNDAEIGLIYMGARYYEPSLGRFVSADTIVASLADPQSLNRYSYVDNNPINNTDPTGHREMNCQYGEVDGRCGNEPSTPSGTGSTGTNPIAPGANGSNPPVNKVKHALQLFGLGSWQQTTPESNSYHGYIQSGDLVPVAELNGVTMYMGCFHGDHCGGVYIYSLTNEQAHQLEQALVHEAASDTSPGGVGGNVVVNTTIDYIADKVTGELFKHYAGPVSALKDIEDITNQGDFLKLYDYVFETGHDYMFPKGQPQRLYPPMTITVADLQNPYTINPWYGHQAAVFAATPAGGSSTGVFYGDDVFEQNLRTVLYAATQYQP